MSSDRTIEGRSGQGPLRPVTIALAVLLPFAIGYFLSQMFRSVNAVVGPDLVHDVGLSAAELGFLTSAYLLAFALFQLPLGVLLDRYGPRRVQSVLIALAGGGSLLFAIGESFLTLTLARALIGLGFAGGLMSGFKAVVIWVPEDRRALANAIVMSFGALGILVATQPIDLSVQAFGWREVFQGLGVITFAVALLIFFVVPEKVKPSSNAGGLMAQVAAIGSIIGDAAFWRLAPLLATTAGAHIAIQTLWAGLWFRDVAGMDREGVASHLMAVAIAFMIGILLSGAVADWFVRRGAHILSVMNAFLAVFLLSELLIILDIESLMLPAWLLFGMTGQVAILAYPWLSSHYGIALSGRANTAMNLLIFGTAFGTQYAIGEIIDLFPSGIPGEYRPEAYQVGFGLCLAVQLAALVWYGLGFRSLRGAPPKDAQAD
ncbi:MAG: MFS transporter [Pseudomonadota bacterium]